MISDEQLQRALNVQRKRRSQLNRPFHLGLILVELGYVSEQDVLNAINERYRLSLNSLSDNVEELIRKKYGSLRQRMSACSIPIALKLAVMTTLLIILTIFTLSVVILNQQREQLYDQSIRTGRISLSYFVSNARLLLLEDDNVLRLNTLITESVKIDGIRYAIILDQNRIIKAHTDYRQIGNPFQAFKNVTKISDDGITACSDHYLPSGEHMLNLNRDIVLQGKKLGEVHVGLSLDFIEQLIWQKSRTLIWVSLGTISLGIMVAVLIGLHFSRPISGLVEATREISKGNFQHRVDQIRNDELGDLAMAFNRMSRDLWIKSLMQKSFGKYIGSEILEMIMVDPETPWLKGRRNVATILFTDVRGFTAYSEQREPEEVVDRLNEYFEVAANAILRHGGYIDKFVGDAVLGVFGVPVAREDHMERAVRAALEMQQGFCDHAESTCEDTLLNAIGIGINAGVVVSGNIGSQVKMEYTVIGDAVNVASRLNGLAGPGEVIISRNIREYLGDLIEVEACPPQKIKGKVIPVEVFKVLGIRKKESA
ncbi:hypothetical protein DENIS_1027 [Desulfonema ishimotonii]|uniref:Adenylate/guanylate cyclase domain-containing protein n=1 Tax=Desulfonema ishimotonii TaxID=45657 RepID=A0A401FSZ8_9BACT|nr:adenylate/guanylate cyclase domain-containing protein [Desulfonema ishimotonii]GBC60083.1 hypothetical protein DENIS_1027 [Desulfonema ishimotonii]